VRILIGDSGSLAVFGSEPIFSHVRTTGQLANRDPERFFALASGAFERRWLTNRGPLLTELEESLRLLHGADHCVAFANACFALVLALKALGRPGAKKVSLPALTFRGLPHVIRWAGLEPDYCDVDPIGHTLSTTAVKHAIGPDTAAILAVDNVNALCDVNALETIAARAGVPLILDCVYGILGNYGNSPVGSRGACSVFSLHATKLINGFEGGYLTTNDADLAATLRKSRTFGFGDEAIPQGLGLNAKLNEIHAAMALSNLPHIASIAHDNRNRFEKYENLFSDLPWVSFAAYNDTVSAYGLVLMKIEQSAPYQRDDIIRIMRAENALVRPYYSPALHLSDVGCKGNAVSNMPVSEAVSRSFIQMPVGDLVSQDDIHRMRELFGYLDAHADSILERLRAPA
jgi:dTDP-4-amino-4,6-dideoxygalactose transaminase